MHPPTSGKTFSFDIKLLRTVCIALLSAQVPALVATLPLGLHAPAAIAQAQSAEAVAKIAKGVTVRIEGATQGSGVLVKRVGNSYTLLTAWHVVSGQGPGEELDIYTADGKRHQFEQNSIKQLGEVDLAVLTFSSPNSYEIAHIGDIKGVGSGSRVYVSGFPLPTSAVPSRIFRFMKGDVIANATVAIPDGYQLLYDNQTLPGVSGGAVLNAQGQLIGIHGKAEKADQVSESSGKAVATGTNQGVPISYYKQYAAGKAVVASSAQAVTADDYLAQARLFLGKNRSKQEAIRLATQALAIKQSAEAYFYRAYAKSKLGDKLGAIADYNQAIALNSQYAQAYSNRGAVKLNLGDKQGAITDCNQAIAINPQLTHAYVNRGSAKSDLGDEQGAIADYNQAISIDPKDADAYYNRGAAKSSLGDKQGAIADYNQAIAINPQDAQAYSNRGNAKFNLGDKQGAIADYNQAIGINPQLAQAHYNRGTAKFSLGDKQGAIADYNQAIAINPQDADVYNNRGTARFNLGDRQGAIADYNQAIAINPQLANAWGARGFAKSQLGDQYGGCDDMRRSASLGSTKAERLLPQVCRLDQKRGGVEQSRTQLLKGSEKFEMGDTKGAISSYTMAISLDPKNADAYYKRCYAKWTLRDYKGVIVDCNHSINIDPRMLFLTKLAGALSDAYAEVGDRKNACKVLRSARLTNSMYYASYCK